MLSLMGALVIACGSDVRIRAGSPDDDDGGGGSGGQPVISKSDKIDLLLVVDNSRGMADKQAVLQAAVPDLVAQLTNLNVRDIHIGVITTSLGSHGADSCIGQNDASENDRGHFITRETTGPVPGTVPTYEGLGFLVWDPDPTAPTHSPPGDSSAATLTDSLAMLVAGAGEVGCGYESTLEAWYRFLVDPNPYEYVELQNASAVPIGTDQTLLTQRKNFLRPDSLVAIVMLSDENDCSIRDGGQYFFAAQIFAPGTTSPYHLPKPRPECATNPDDPCCRSCAQVQDGCPDASAHCDANGDGKPDFSSALEDPVALRCYAQKRRFGIDFLYPIDRYVDGLTLPQVPDRNGDIQQNPLFATLQRAPDLVLLAGIVGVPWQDIARRNASGAPDLLAGCKNGDCADPAKQVGGFQTAAELEDNDTWSLILGDPTCYASTPGCLPQDPLMIESIDPRAGTHPLTGDPIAPPGNPEGNAINGSEYDIPARDDLQYACIFPLPTPRDCSMSDADVACFCQGLDPDNLNENPICWNGTTFENVQTKAKAHPAIRQLQVLQQISHQAVVTSICPPQQTDPTLPNFAYRPSVTAIVEAMNPHLNP